MASRTEKSKGGYDYDFVHPPSKSLECPVCLLTLRNPHVISCCGNEFCQACIERVQRDGKPCPLCNEPQFTTFLHKKLVREVNALVVRCPQKELGCDWQGELGQLQSHLNPGVGGVSSKGCGFVLMECAYQCGAQLQRRLLQEHEMEICPKRPIEMQVASLMQKIEAIAVDFKRVTVENQQLRQELSDVKEAHKQELSRVNQQMDKMKQDNQLELNLLRQELGEVKKQNKYFQTAQKEQLQKMCDDLKSEQNIVKMDIDTKTAMQNTKLSDLEKQCLSLQAHKMPMPVPPFYFTVPNVNHYQQNNLFYWSEPFYSHPGGYKMVVDVIPNGLGSSQGAYMSVYVAILRGEFDDQLCWPFDGSVTVQAYNRTTQQWSNECTIVLNQYICGLEKVTRCVDSLGLMSWGLSRFLSLTQLKADYLKDTDMVKFRIVKVIIK